MGYLISGRAVRPSVLLSDKLSCDFAPVLTYLEKIMKLKGQLLFRNNQVYVKTEACVEIELIRGEDNEMLFIRQV